jgi:large subunit ribosomal protein L25
MAGNELQVRPRQIIGKKVARLRRDGVTPANVYGHRIESKAVQANTIELSHLLRSMGRNALISLKIEDERAPRTVMIRDVARDPLSGRIHHVDFYQVNLTEKMKAEVPVILAGTSEAVTTFGGVLMQMVDVIHVEALPADLPSEYTVDVGQITELEQAIHVRDLHIDGGKVTVLSDPDVVVAKVAAPRLAAEEEEVEAAPEEAAEAAGEAAPESEAGESA